MERNQSRSKQNQIFIKGEIEKIRLDYSEKVPKILFAPPQPLSRSSRNFPIISPEKIYTQGTSIAAIDQNNEGWLLTEKFEIPINISDLIRSKVLRLYLGEKELIAQTKRGYYLINWGTKKLLEPHMLIKQNISAITNFDSLFQVYSISSSDSADIYEYCPEKKVDNSNRLYYFDANNLKINGYPTGQVLQVKHTIKGLSIGQHYCLGWDSEGHLYSWGNKSIGLGYVELPSQEFIEQPQIVKINKKVLCAYAASHYSLALTEEGILYEWGIKKEVNQINEEPIFYPRPLTFKYFKCKAKFVELKGKQNNFAALGSNGQLYVWGATAKRLISEDLQLPSTWKGNYLYQPVLQTEFVDHFIHDFAIDSTYLLVVAGHSDKKDLEINPYWSILKKKARRQIEDFKNTRISTETDEIQHLKKKYKNSIMSCKTNTQNSERKRKFIQKSKTVDLQQRQQDKIRLKKTSERSSSLQKLFLFKRTAPVTSQNYWQTHKRQISDISNQTKEQQIKVNRFRTSQSSAFDSQSGLENKSGVSLLKKQKFSQIYQLKLQQMIEKKKHLENNIINGYIRRITDGSLQNRVKRKQQEQQRSKMHGDQKFLHQILGKVLIKKYISTLIVNTVDLGRAIKIQNFSKHLSIERIERNIRNMFVAKKAKFMLQKMKQFSLFRYLTFIFFLKKHIRNFKKRKFNKSKEYVVTELIKNSLSQKMDIGMFNLRKKICRIRKLKNWMKIYEKQQLLAFKEVWNNCFLYTFKLKDGADIYFNQADPQITLLSLWKEKCSSNPILKLDKYMKYTSTFMPTVRMIDALPNKTILKKKGQKKIHEELKIKCSLSSEILPFSIHYNIFRRPKNLDINVGESNRSAPMWIDIERKSLEQMFMEKLYAHNRQSVIARRDYQIDLANFIALNYESFYERRWKFILEYNKVEKTPQKKKRQNQLKRILGLIGKTKLFDEDCIPQKHMVLEQALKRLDGPEKPSPVLHFGLDVFEDNFKAYVERLKGKIRQYKKNFY